MDDDDSGLVRLALGGAAGVAVSDLEEEPGYSSFRVTDPDGSMVEVFAE